MTTPTPVAVSQAEALRKVGTIAVNHDEIERHKAYFMYGHNTSYVLPDGAKLIFAIGAVPAVAKPGFVTNVKGFIEELDKQIAARHPVIHIEPGYEYVTKDMLDPLDGVKKQAVQDFMKSEEFQKFLLNSKGVGTPANSKSSQPSLQESLVGSDKVVEGAAASDSAVGSAPPATPMGVPFNTPVGPGVGTAATLASLKR